MSLTYGFKSRLPHQVRGFAKAKPLSFLPFVSYFVAGFESDFTPNRLKIELCSEYPSALPMDIIFTFLNPNLCSILRWVCCKPYGKLLFPCRANPPEHQQFCVSLWLEHEFEHRKSFEHGMNTT